jgi:hypothetical protein
MNIKIERLCLAMSMVYFCTVCKRTITDGVNEYSIKHFGKALCMIHQKSVKERNSYYCVECRMAITYEMYKYSIDKFEEPLCYGCQPEEDTTESSPPQKSELNRTSLIEFGKKDS